MFENTTTLDGHEVAKLAVSSGGDLREHAKMRDQLGKALGKAIAHKNPALAGVLTDVEVL